MSAIRYEMLLHDEDVSMPDGLVHLSAVHCVAIAACDTYHNAQRQISVSFGDDAQTLTSVEARDATVATLMRSTQELGLRVEEARNALCGLRARCDARRPR